MKYIDNINSITPEQLQGFFFGWKQPLSTEQHFNLLKGSSHFIVAVDDNKIVGFITALSDGVISSFIPLLEVLPEYKGKGIGTELVRLMFEKLDDILNIDLTCDSELQPFYERFKMMRSTGMIMRKYINQP